MSDDVGTESVIIRDVPDDHRYVIEVDGEVAGLAVYHLRGGRHFFVHTEVSPDYSGRGLGQQLVRFALNDVRSQQGVVVPICPFFAAYIRRHPEYEDLVDRQIMERIEKSRHDQGES